MATQRALASRTSRPAAASASGARRPARSSSRGGSECYRCGERGHRVKDCPVKPSRRPKHGNEKPKCWRCGLSTHILRDCPDPPSRVSYAGAEGGDSSAAPFTPCNPVAAVAHAMSAPYYPPRRVLGWMEVDEEGVVVDGGEVPRGFYLEDVVREPSSSARE